MSGAFETAVRDIVAANRFRIPRVAREIVLDMARRRDAAGTTFPGSDAARECLLWAANFLVSAAWAHRLGIESKGGYSPVHVANATYWEDPVFRAEKAAFVSNAIRRGTMAVRQGG